MFPTPRSPLTHPSTMRVALAIAEAVSRRMRRHPRGPAVHPFSLRGSSDEGRQEVQSGYCMPVTRAQMHAVAALSTKDIDAMIPSREFYSRHRCSLLRSGHTASASDLLSARTPHKSGLSHCSPTPTISRIHLSNPNSCHYEPTRTFLTERHTQSAATLFLLSLRVTGQSYTADHGLFSITFQCTPAPRT